VTRCMRCCAQPASTSAGCCVPSPGGALLQPFCARFGCCQRSQRRRVDSLLLHVRRFSSAPRD